MRLGGVGGGRKTGRRTCPSVNSLISPQDLAEVPYSFLEPLFRTSFATLINPLFPVQGPYPRPLLGT